MRIDDIIISGFVVGHASRLHMRMHGKHGTLLLKNRAFACAAARRGAQQNH